MLVKKGTKAEETRLEQGQQEQDKEAKLVGEETVKAEDIAIINISNIQPSKAKANSLANGQSSFSFKVINTPKSGKRVVSKEEIIEYLGTEELEIGFDENSMVLAAKGVGINEYSYAFRKDKSNYVLYNANLVTEITEHFELDFTKTTTVGFKVIKAKAEDGTKLIKLIK